MILQLVTEFHFLHPLPKTFIRFRQFHKVILKDSDDRVPWDDTILVMVCLHTAMIKDFPVLLGYLALDIPWIDSDVAEQRPETVSRFYSDPVIQLATYILSQPFFQLECSNVVIVTVQQPTIETRSHGHNEANMTIILIGATVNNIASFGDTHLFKSRYCNEGLFFKLILIVFHGDNSFLIYSRYNI